MIVALAEVVALLAVEEWLEGGADEDVDDVNSVDSVDGPPATARADPAAMTAVGAIDDRRGRGRKGAGDPNMDGPGLAMETSSLYALISDGLPILDL